MQNGIRIPQGGNCIQFENSKNSVQQVASNIKCKNEWRILQGTSQQKSVTKGASNMHTFSKDKRIFSVSQNQIWILFFIKIKN